jgi:hypothetical protein
MLEKVAHRYRQEGYDVTLRPSAADLPAFLANAEVDLIARKGNESVAVQVKRRDELYDIGPLAETVNAQPGWSYDLVVYPRPSDEGIPADATEPGGSYIDSLLAEADRLLGAGGMRGAFLIAWSAAEAAMREVGRRDAIEVNSNPPRFVLKSLYANGLMSREDYERLEHCYSVRSALIHGARPASLEGDDIQFLAAFARQLLSGEPAPTE